jgi:hypothetical protein
MEVIQEHVYDIKSESLYWRVIDAPKQVQSLRSITRKIVTSR